MPLLRDARGTATIEFALLTLFFLGIVSVALDLGMYVQQKLRLGAAVEQGALMAFNTRAAVQPANIVNYVNAAAGTAVTPSTTALCNQAVACSNDSAARTAVCWSTASKTFVTPPGEACADGAQPGYYMTIRAQYRYAAMIVPNRFLGGSTVVQTAVVRLQ